MKETALWTNPNLLTVEGDIYRVHVLGLGEETHAFHLHGHRWTEDIHEKASVEDIIDVKEITPLQRHTFIIQASDNDTADKTHDGSEGWMYHCHFTDHMKQGMSGMMNVLPEYESDDLPVIGAVFTLSDEPGLWMKTLNAGVADDLDNYLSSLGLIEARNGTGFPLGYISDALETAVPGNGTKFSNSEGRSLAVINPGETVLFGMKDSQTKHTITTLIYPEEATPLGGNGILRVAGLGHYDQQLGIRGSAILTDTDGVPVGLDTPGLYVFVCKIHPYMFGAVVVDDPDTRLQLFDNPDLPFPLLDFSGNLTVLVRANSTNANNEIGFPTYVSPASDLAGGLLTTFFEITDPNNWKDYTQTSWHISLPPVLVTTDTEGLVASLTYTTNQTVAVATALNLTTSSGVNPMIVGLELGDEHMPITPPTPPESIQGVGEVWVNTQFERTAAKNHDGAPADKPGTITVVDTDTWTVERKIALPEINMNHPHNMWTDKKNEVIYQTQWFGNEMAVIDRESGELIKEVFTGQSPSHVMTSPTTDMIYVAMNGEDTVNEFDPETLEMTRQISTGFRSHPHGHWVSSSGNYVVTPDFLGLKASIIDLNTNTVNNSEDLLLGPIATGLKSDDSIFYTADFLGNSLTGIDPSNGISVSSIDWITEGVGLPIQTPISPDDKWMVTALTLGSQVGIVDVSSPNPNDHAIVEIIPCDPGCHGVQWGAKAGSDDYLAYVSSKFSNALIVIDPTQPLGEKEIGRILLADRFADSDDKIIGYDGMGGQGVLAIPNVYSGWINVTAIECGITNANPCSQEVVTFLSSLSQEQRDKRP